MQYTPLLLLVLNGRKLGGVVLELSNLAYLRASDAFAWRDGASGTSSLVSALFGASLARGAVGIAPSFGSAYSAAMSSPAASTLSCATSAE